MQVEVPDLVFLYIGCNVANLFVIFSETDFAEIGFFSEFLLFV